MGSNDPKAMKIKQGCAWFSQPKNNIVNIAASFKDVEM